MRGSRGSYSSRGGSTRGNYGSSYGSRAPNSDRPRYNSYNTGGAHERSYGSGYGNRSRDDSGSGGGGRYQSAPYKRPYDSSRDRSDDRKRPRQDDYRRPSSTSGRGDRPSGPPIGRSSSSYRGSATHSSSYQARDSMQSRHHRTSPMGPPKRGPVRGISSGYGSRPRGAGPSSIGSRPIRVTIRGGASFVRSSRPIKDDTEMRSLRKKLIFAERKDRARVMRIQQLTSSLRRRDSGKEKRSNEDLSDHSRDDDDDAKKSKAATDKGNESEDDWVLSSPSPVKKRKSSTDEGDNDDGASENGVDNEDSVKSKSNVVENEEESAKTKGGEEIEGKGTAKLDDSVNEDDDEKKSKDKLSAEKSGKKKEKDESNEGKDTSAKSDRDEKKRSRDDQQRTQKNHDSSRLKDRTRNFIKLKCIHCHVKCITFKEYSHHLTSRGHSNGLRRVAQRQRSELVRLRARQRAAQRVIEEGISEEVESKFCRICRLAYRQTKAEHQASEHHRTIKKFLMPYCSSCHQAFKSPMIYEVHRCSIDHIRNKVRNEDSESDESADEREIDLNKFLTVDSVGEVEDGTLETEIDAMLAEIEAPNEDGDDSEQKLPGSECVKIIESFYCELCNHYSAKVGDTTLEAYLVKHCKSRSHIRAYIHNNTENETNNLNSVEESAEKDGNELADEEMKPDDEVTEEVQESTELDKSAETENGDGDNDEDSMDAEEIDDPVQAGDKSGADLKNGEKACEEDVEKALGDLLADVPREVDDDEDDEEDECVLNIDIESENVKSKQKDDKEINGKNDAPVAKQEPGKAQPIKSVPKPPATPSKSKPTSNAVTAKTPSKTRAAPVVSPSKAKATAPAKAATPASTTKPTITVAAASTKAAVVASSKSTVVASPLAKAKPQRKAPAATRKAAATAAKSSSQK